MRGMSILELLIAITILSGTILSVLFITTELPRAVRNGAYEISALQNSVSTLLPQLRNSTVPTVEGHTFIRTTWRDASGRAHIRNDSALSATSTSLCEGYVRGNWSAPRIQTYALSPADALPSNFQADTFWIDALGVSPNYLVVGIGSTTLSSAQTLFIFSLPTEQFPKPSYVGSIDNASTTKLGIRALAVNNSFVYAATNQNASYTTCSQSTACAQLQIFQLASSGPSLVTSLQLPTRSGSYASGSNGQSAGRSITYANNLIYLGLTKGGDARTTEFNIIDVHDPKNPLWLGGYHLGHGVTSIAVQAGVAYLATDDTTQEFIALDVHDPAHITQLSSYDTPGNPVFGYGSAIALARPPDPTDTTAHIVLARTYVPNASELLFLTNQAAHTTLSGSMLSGNTTGESIQALVVKDFLALVATNSKLYLLDMANPSAGATFAAPLSIGSDAEALTCSGSTIVVGGNDSARHTGILTIVKP